MDVRTVSFVEGAKQATGIAVIIDVFRAFSVACYAFDQGAARILPVAGIAEAKQRALSEKNSILIGERHGKKLPGFDLGNSPTELLDADVRGKTLIHTTHSGTQGLTRAFSADQILTGALVNAKATADYIKSQNPDTVTLVRMGLEAVEDSDEDTICAEYLESLLLDRPFDAGTIKPFLAASPYSQRFFDPDKPWNPESDFEYCLDIDRFDFALQAVKLSDGKLELKQIIR